MLEEENNTKKDEVKTSEGISFEFIYSRYFCNFIIQHNSFPVS